jgi:hypothetical protein
MFLERVYNKDSEFKQFTKKLGRLKIEQAMSDCSYLLPPRQRSIACFMNLSKTVSWAEKVLCSYPSFTGKEQEIYGFVVKNKSLVEELQVIFELTNQILYNIKTNGLSYQSIGQALSSANKLPKKRKKRVEKYIALVKNYLLEELMKLESSYSNIHASSDIIESVFGRYKLRKSSNSLHGATSYVLTLALVTKLRKSGMGIDTDIKANLESVYMRDLSQWKEDYLIENQAIKRMRKLAG